MTLDLSKKIIGYAIFAILIVVHITLGPVALVRALGVVLMASGGYSFFQCNIPYGIKGRPPSGYLTGSKARFISVAMVCLGLVMAATAPKAACILGWAQLGSCA